MVRGMKLSLLAVSLFATVTVAWAVTSKAPVSFSQHALGVSKGLGLPAPELLHTAKRAACAAAWQDTVAEPGSQALGQVRAEHTPTYCVPYNRADFERVREQLPDLLLRGPSASGFYRMQDQDAFMSSVKVNVMFPFRVTVQVHKTRPVILMMYDAE